MLPLLLTATRAALAPVVILIALFWPNRSIFALCLVVALLSDIFDGAIARRLGVATPTLRRLDSTADSLFYLAVAFAAWHLQPSVIINRWEALLVLTLLELTRYILDFLKFGREASYHMWSSKAWGLTLFAGFLSLLAFGTDTVLVDIMIYVGITADVEGIAISLVLDSWQGDVPTVFHAIRLSRRERARRAQ